MPAKLLIILFSFSCVLAASTSALACACCINPGYYEISTVRPSTVDLALIDELKFGPTAEFYMSEAGFDMIRGLAELRKDSEANGSIELNIIEAFVGRSWRFDIKTGAGRSGSLALPMPATMVRYKVDIHDYEPGTEPRLYKELRFKGTVRNGGGFFRTDMAKPTSYFLVFQGHGNGCDSSADYSYWRLELSGPRADYAFYGKLNQ